jgi:hypothetical protein
MISLSKVAANAGALLLRVLLLLRLLQLMQTETVMTAAGSYLRQASQLTSLTMQRSQMLQILSSSSSSSSRSLASQQGVLRTEAQSSSSSSGLAEAGSRNVQLTVQLQRQAQYWQIASHLPSAARLRPRYVRQQQPGNPSRAGVQKAEQQQLQQHRVLVLLQALLQRREPAVAG